MTAGAGGRIVPHHRDLEAKSVVGTVLFTPGQPLSAGVPARAKLPDGSLTELRRTAAAVDAVAGRRHVSERRRGAGAARRRAGPASTSAATTGGTVQVRGRRPRPARCRISSSSAPRERLEEGDSYTVLGLVRDITPDELRAAPARAIRTGCARTYLGLPDDARPRGASSPGSLRGAEPTAVRPGEGDRDVPAGVPDRLQHRRYAARPRRRRLLPVRRARPATSTTTPRRWS